MTPDPTPDPDEDIAHAVAIKTGQSLGNLLILVLETVSRTNPDMLREAIGRVFDLSAWQEQADRIAATVQSLQRQARELQQLLADVECRIGRIRRPD